MVNMAAEQKKVILSEEKRDVQVDGYLPYYWLPSYVMRQNGRIQCRELIQM